MKPLAVVGAGVLGLLVGALLGPILLVPVEGALGIRKGVLVDAMRIEDTVMVMVFARSLPKGAVIAEEDLFAVETPVWLYRDGWLLSPEYVVGMRTTDDVLANGFVRRERLEVPEGDESPALAVRIRWTGYRCGVLRDEPACGTMREAVRMAVGSGDVEGVAVAAETLVDVGLVAERNTLVPRLWETRAALPLRPNASADVPWGDHVSRFIRESAATGEACRRARKDPEGAVRLKEEARKEEEVFAEAREWAGEGFVHDALAQMLQGKPFVRCAGARPVTVVELDALWSQVARQSRR